MADIFFDYINTSEENYESEKDLENIFLNLLDQISHNLDIDPVINKVKIYVEDDIIESQDIFSLGTNRDYHGSSVILHISPKYKKFYQFIILREVYYCFLPLILYENKIIKIFINIIIQINLKKHEACKEWSQIIKENIVDQEYLDAHFDLLGKFLEIQTEDNDNLTKFFFNYVRKNINLLEKKTVDFYDDLFTQFIFKISKTMRDDEIIETLRILIKIFYNVKSYKALHEYKRLFSKFKEDGTIKTELSLRKFVQNMRWIKNFTIISPSYKINHFQMGVIPYILKIDFHPKISKYKVRNILEKFPFLQNVRITENGFSTKMTGYEILPKQYKEDFLLLLKKLENQGYITRIYCIECDYIENNLNLNYFREYHNDNILINKNHKKYNNEYEIQFKHNLEKDPPFYPLNLLDFLIMDSIRYFSITGFGFDPNRESIKQLKTKLMSEILNQASLIKNLKLELKKLYQNVDFKDHFLYILDYFKNAGSFFVKEFLESITVLCKQIEEIISNNSEIYNISTFQTFVNKNNLSLFPYYIINDELKTKFINTLIPLFFSNKGLYKKEVKKYTLFLTIFKLCFNLKIFSLKAIEKITKNEEMVKTIYSKKQLKLNELYETYKSQELTYEKIDNIIDNYLNSEKPLIKPILINTIPTTHFAKYHLSITVKDNTNTRRVIEKIKSNFPRFSLTRGSDIISNEKLNHIDIYFPNIEVGEKKKIILILKKLFKDDLIDTRRMFFHGCLFAYSLKDYFDFENASFFYTKDLFEQYYLFIKKIFGQGFNKIEYNKDFYEDLGYNNNNFTDLIENIRDRESREQNNYNIKDIYQLGEFHQNLNIYLLNQEKYKIIKKSPFFKKYVKTIKFTPAFQNFGLSNYYLWLKPTHFDQIDKKLLFSNTFLSIKNPIEFEKSSDAYLINYIFPFRRPNDKYINWLAKSKKIIGEYFFFYIKKIYHILQFNNNLSSSDWNLNAKRFQNYSMNLLYNNHYKIKNPFIREFDLSSISDQVYDPSSEEFKYLYSLFSFKPKNIKSFLGRESHHLIEPFHSLLEKNLIFPYLDLKNLGFKEKIYIFIPKISLKMRDLLVRIFSYFNYVFLYEISGDFYIKETSNIKSFETGLFVELYLPNCEFSEFENTFFDIFKRINIGKYLILHDLDRANMVISNLYGNFNFLKEYNPIKNLEWNKKDKIWMNSKLFDEKFNFIYPKLKL